MLSLPPINNRNAKAKISVETQTDKSYLKNRDKKVMFKATFEIYKYNDNAGIKYHRFMLFKE